MGICAGRDEWRVAVLRKSRSGSKTRFAEPKLHFEGAMSDRVAGVVPGGLDPRALPDLSQRAHSAHRIAAVVAGVFLVAGLAWIFLTDIILYAISFDRAFVARVETAKGWLFVGLAALLLYAVTFRSAARLDRVRRLTAAIVDSIADGLLLLGHDRSIAYANPAAEKMLNCSRQELIGMGAAAFATRFRVSYANGGMVPPGQFVSQRVFDEGGPLHYTSILHPPNRSELVLSSTAAAIRMEVGAPAVWVVSVMHDITDTYRLDRMRDQFFAAAAHSLKTPVAVIKADVQALQSAGASAQPRVTASISRQCDRIDRLVQNLLVLTRARSQTLQLHPSEMELRPLIERISAERAWSYRHDVHAEVTGSPSLHADQERLALAIRNLLYEASRMSPADSRLTLLARPEGDGVAVGVRYQPVPWHDQVSDTYGEYDDIGIGRTVAQTIVESHGGSLREEATDSERTSWMHLPADVGAPP
jgi:signal transduction histidine kinase